MHDRRGDAAGLPARCRCRSRRGRSAGCPARPATDAHQARAWSSERGLAAGLPVDVEHGVAPEHERRAVECLRRRPAPSARPAPGATSWVGPVTSSSSTPLTITSGAKPASQQHAPPHGRGRSEHEPTGHPTSVAAGAGLCQVRWRSRACSWARQAAAKVGWTPPKGDPATGRVEVDAHRGAWVMRWSTTSSADDAATTAAAPAHEEPPQERPGRRRRRSDRAPRGRTRRRPGRRRSRWRAGGAGA